MDDSEHHLPERVNAGHDPAATLAEGRQRDGAQQGDEQHLDDLAVGEGADERLRDDVQQEREDTTRGLLQGAERPLGLGRVWRHIQAFAGSDEATANCDSNIDSKTMHKRFVYEHGSGGPPNSRMRQDLRNSSND